MTFIGIRLVGEPLFSSVDLDHRIRADFYSAAEEHLASMAQDEQRPSHAVLLNSFAEFSCPTMDLVLGPPGPIEPQRARGTSGLVLACKVPFAGDADWFRYSARTAPAMRPARATVGRETLILAVEVIESEFEEWVPAVLGAELARIRHNLALLARLPERINEDLLLRARYMVQHMQRLWAVQGHRRHRAVSY